MMPSRTPLQCNHPLQCRPLQSSHPQPLGGHEQTISYNSTAPTPSFPGTMVTTKTRAKFLPISITLSKPAIGSMQVVSGGGIVLLIDNNSAATADPNFGVEEFNFADGSKLVI